MATRFDFMGSKLLNSEFKGCVQRKLFLSRNSISTRSHLGVGLGRLSSLYTRSVGLRSLGLGKVKAIVSGDVNVTLGDEVKLSVDKVIHFFRVPLIQDSAADELLRTIQMKISNEIVGLKTE
uniref:Uncharacterized protein n=2 Tax=Chenopodium quinoa TaxID=63459 RepID=A0A803KTB5_CHEQI